LSVRGWGAAAAAAAVITAIGAATQALRLADRRRAAAVWASLAERRWTEATPFAPEMVADLPEAAQRYLRFAIAVGTPLRRVAELDMVGRFGLGDRNRPRYLPMRAREIIAPPDGFVWTTAIGAGFMRFSGLDGCAGGAAWTRVWLLGMLPIVRPAVTPDLVRSARARAVLEALWVPAALLPANGAHWEAIDVDRVRAVFETAGERHTIDLRLAADGRPVEVSTRRWSNANPERVYRWQPFGGTIEAVGTFGGYRVPVRLAVGNHFGTAAYFPFFEAEIVDIRYR
jgi:hypothetical protein